MSLLRLVHRNIWRHPVRTLLTFGFAVLALFLFVFLQSVVATLETSTKVAAANRIAVQASTSLFVYMPEWYWKKIEQVPGVESANPFVWFGSYYRQSSNFFAGFAVDIKTLLDQYPEIVVPPAQRAALLEGRMGALVGRELADKYGWKPGDRVPVLSNIYTLPKGGAWTFDVAAVFRSTKPNIDEKTFYFSYDYLKEMRRQAFGADFPSGNQDVGVWLVKVKDGFEPEKVMADIDALFDSGPQRTRTQTEAAFQAQFVSMLGNIPVFLGWIGGAVLFAIFFSVLNTAGMSGRERSRDVGILKALGFRDRLGGMMLVLESMAVVGVGAAIGVLLGWASAPYFGDRVAAFIPNYHVGSATIHVGLLIALLIGFVGGLVPAIRLARLRTVDVLRQEA